MAKYQVFDDEGGLPVERYWSITHPHRRTSERFNHRYRKDAPKLRALVVVHCGVLKELCHIGKDLEWFIDESGEDMSDHLKDDGPDLPNGVYIFEGEVKDDGCYDSYFGCYESDCYLEGVYRPATKEEWEYHVNGEYPWDPALWFADSSSEVKEDSNEDEGLKLFNPDLKT